VTIGVLAGHDDAGLVRLFAARHSGVDRDRDADEIGDGFVYGPAGLLDQRAVPQCSGHIVEDLGIEFLPPETGALYFFMICARKAGAKLARL
jgi:hypothetical protein